MTKKLINQNGIYNLELLHSVGYDHTFENKPINRLKNKIKNSEIKKGSKLEYLKGLKNEINTIEDCKLKEKSTNIIFGEGNINSPLMIIGGAPNKIDDLSGNIFSGEDGVLLIKMLNAINITKENIYITNAINYFLEDGTKASSAQIKRYSIFLKKHIAIINPKIIVLMGTIAMEAITGLKDKISIERGKWKETIIENTNYKLMITFDPSYLLRAPENKRFSWLDLKSIKNIIDELRFKI